MALDKIFFILHLWWTYKMFIWNAYPFPNGDQDLRGGSQQKIWCEAGDEGNFSGFAA
jgi:hypothetical protein